MKIIKTDIKLVNFKGEVLKSNKEDVVVGDFMAEVLAMHSENPSRCWQLGKKFATEKEVELKAEDVVFLKDALVKASTGERAHKNALACGQVIELIDGKEEKKD